MSFLSIDGLEEQVLTFALNTYIQELQILPISAADSRHIQNAQDALLELRTSRIADHSITVRCAAAMVDALKFYLEILNEASLDPAEALSAANLSRQKTAAQRLIPRLYAMVLPHLE